MTTIMEIGQGTPTIPVPPVVPSTVFRALDFARADIWRRIIVLNWLACSVYTCVYMILRRPEMYLGLFRGLRVTRKLREQKAVV